MELKEFQKDEQDFTERIPKRSSINNDDHGNRTCALSRAASEAGALYDSTKNNAISTSFLFKISFNYSKLFFWLIARFFFLFRNQRIPFFSFNDNSQIIKNKILSNFCCHQFESTSPKISLCSYP
jgi:hypothetical protein